MPGSAPPVVPASRTPVRPGGGRRFPHLRAAVLLAGALPFPGGCSGGETEIDPQAALPVVVQSPTAGTRDPSSPDALARGEQAFAAAEAAWRAGDPLSALAIANKALREGVPPELEPRFRELRARARGAVLASKIVRIRAVPLKDVVATGEAVPVRILVRNLSSAELRAPQTLPGSSDALFVLEVERSDVDLLGGRRTTVFTVRAPLPADLSIAPGGEREVQVSIAPELVALEHEGVTLVRIGGTFRPVSIQVGETEVFDAIPIEPARVRVLPQGFEPLAADPLASLRAAVAKRSPRHVMTCVELLAPTDRAEARALLEAAAGRDAELAPYLRPVLERLDEMERPAASAGGAAE